MGELPKLVPCDGEISISIKVTKYIFNVRSLGKSCPRNFSEVLDYLCEFKSGEPTICIHVIFIEEFHEKYLSTYLFHIFYFTHCHRIFEYRTHFWAVSVFLVNLLL